MLQSAHHTNSSLSRTLDCLHQNSIYVRIVRFCSSCQCLTTVWILSHKHRHTHTHWESQENGKCLRLDSIRSVYRVHLFLSHRVLKQFEGRHKRDVNVNGLKAEAAATTVAATVSVRQ